MEKEIAVEGSFKEDRYCVIRSAIDYSLVSFLTQYAFFDMAQNYSSESGERVITGPEVHARYADPAMESLLLYLQPLVEKVSEKSLYPTYSFYRIYQNGSSLKKHIDRPSCEISCTMSLDFSYSDTDKRWPIIIEGKEIFLDPGDLVLYKGMELAHWRDEFDLQNFWHVQGFFHYVDANGPFAEYKFDNREGIGLIGEK